MIDDDFKTEQFPASYREGAEPMTMLGAGVPMASDGVVVGALSIVRRDATDSFRPIEREAMDLLAGHAAWRWPTHSCTPRWRSWPSATR